jgi:hypothetical protein
MDAMRLKRAFAALTAFTAFAVASVPAVAQTCTPDQSVAVLDQYCDALPTSSGPSAPTGAGQHASGPQLMDVLAPPAVARLRESGSAGKALLLLAAMAPVGPGPGAAARRSEVRRAARDVVASGDLQAPTGDAESLATGLAKASGNVIGGAFRWGLVISTLGLAGMSWMRFRTRLRV